LSIIKNSIFTTLIIGLFIHLSGCSGEIENADLRSEVVFEKTDGSKMRLFLDSTFDVHHLLKSFLESQQ